MKILASILVVILFAACGNPSGPVNPCDWKNGEMWVIVSVTDDVTGDTLGVFDDVCLTDGIVPLDSLLEEIGR